MTDVAPAVEHQPAQSRFAITVDSHVARADYTLVDHVITFTHTVVPEALRGRGLGIKLVKAGLRHARDRGLHVVPQCSMFAKYMRKHPDTQDLLAPEGRAYIA